MDEMYPCPRCDRVQAFVHPDCPDGDCAEWACTVCGVALEIDPGLVAVA